MARFLVEIGRLNEEWRTKHRHPRLGAATLHVPLLSGGRHLFVYAGECTAHLECRTVPGQSSGEILAELRGVVESVGREVEGFQCSVDLVQWREPYEVDPEAPIVRTVHASVERVLGVPPRIIGHPWWEDSALLGRAGIETVILGPRGEGLHTDVEWVEADSVVDLAEVLYHSIIAYCGAEEPARPREEGTGA
jgi:acetylornithine deacetylase